MDEGTPGYKEFEVTVKSTGKNTWKEPERTHGDAPDGEWKDLSGTQVLTLFRTKSKSKKATKERFVQRLNAKVLRWGQL